MSEALSHSSYRSHGSHAPEDSISQVLPPYFNNNFQVDIDLENDNSTNSDSLSSAASELLTGTFGSNSIDGHLAGGQSSAAITSDISGMHLTIPAAFLMKRKARKGHG